MKQPFLHLFIFDYSGYLLLHNNSLHYCLHFPAHWLGLDVQFTVEFLTSVSEDPKISEYLPELEVWEGTHHGWQLKLTVDWAGYSAETHSWSVYI